MTATNVTVVRAVIDAPDRARVAYLGADQKWTCDKHPRSADCDHLRALRQLLAGAALKKKRPATP